MTTSPNLQQEILRRRTFAIISHPDAGKTTLTEKILLYGGAIHLAGAVKAKKNQKHTTADWMEIEKQRGITISASVLQFEYEDYAINLLDTPGHQDFSEDTYRTLTAVDAAVMLLDAGKGVEPQTKKLFEVCHLRGIPIFTFINKMDRPARDPLDLLEEIEKVLGIRSYPMTWPLGMGDRFKGVFDREENCFHLFERGEEANAKTKIKSNRVDNIDDPQFRKFVGDNDLLEVFKNEFELVETAGEERDLQKVLAGKLSPVYFGSALTNFGVQKFLGSFLKMAPAPGPRATTSGAIIEPVNSAFSGQVFKIQANMDPAHRDRVAFIRVCSGEFEKNMSVQHARLGKSLKLSRPLNFFAQERIIVEKAWPGDILGIVDTSDTLRIGDTIYTGKKIEYVQLPRFSPEHFATVTLRDPMKRKQLETGLEQLSEEGVVQIYYQPSLGKRDPILAAVGALQFEVLKSRLEMEYRVNCSVQVLPYFCARWVTPEDAQALQELDTRSDSKVVRDRDDNPLVLFKNQWALNWSVDHYPKLEFRTTAPEKLSASKKNDKKSEKKS